MVNHVYKIGSLLENLKVFQLMPKLPTFPFLSFSATPPSGPERPHSQGLYIAHNEAPQSVRLLWMSDQLVA
jgi:hypothetical protein